MRPIDLLFANRFFGEKFRSEILKLVDHAVHQVSDPQRVVGIDIETGGEIEPTGGDPFAFIDVAGTDGEEIFPHLVEDNDLVLAGVRDVNMPGRADGNPFGDGEGAARGAAFAEAVQGGAVGRQHLNPGIHGIDDIKVAIGIEIEVTGVVELARGAAAPADRVEKLTGEIIKADLVLRRIGDVNPVALPIDGKRSRATDAGEINLGQGGFIGGKAEEGSLGAAEDPDFAAAIDKNLLRPADSSGELPVFVIGDIEDMNNTADKIGGKETTLTVGSNGVGLNNQPLRGFLPEDGLLKAAIDTALQIFVTEIEVDIFDLCFRGGRRPEEARPLLLNKGAAATQDHKGDGKKEEAEFHR